MVLDPNILSNELSNLDGSDEITVSNSFATAWVNYFSQSSINGIIATPGSLESAKSSMIAGLSGIINENNGIISIQSGILSFWSSIVASGVSIWITAPNVIVSIVPPVTLSSLSAALQSVVVSNTFLKLDTTTCFMNIANVLHVNAGIGSIVVLQPPGAAPPIPSTII